MDSIGGVEGACGFWGWLAAVSVGVEDAVDGGVQVKVVVDDHFGDLHVSTGCPVGHVGVALDPCLELPMREQLLGLDQGLPSL